MTRSLPRPTIWSDGRKWHAAAKAAPSDGRHATDHCKEDSPQVIAIRSCVDEIHGVQCAVLRAMQECSYTDDACFAVKLALEESIVNAMKHGNRFDESRQVHISFEVDDRQIAIRVKDEGRGFDPAEVPDPRAEENLAKPNGRGIMLMRAYMDEVTYADKGTEVIMVKRKR